MSNFMRFRSAAMLNAVAGAVLFSLSAASPSAAQNNDALYAAAKAEGEFALWSAYDPGPVQRMQEQFAKEYPGVTVNHFEVQPEPAIQRMVAEGAAGQVNADLVHMVVPSMKAALEREMFEGFDWSTTALDPQYSLYDGQCVEMAQVSSPIVINTNLVKEGEITSWEDILDPKWAGKVALEARGRGLATLYQSWGEEKTGAFIDKLKEGNPLIIKGTTPLMEAVAGGQAAIAIGPYAALVISAQNNGAPLDWVRVGPIPAERQFMCVAKDAPHPNAARLFAAWLTTRAGQDELWAGDHWGHVTGDVLSPFGEAVKEAGLEVVLGDTDPDVSQSGQAWVAARVAGK